jgi:alpha-beta hydrolase superfamily lysophospholipase
MRKWILAVLFLFAPLTGGEPMLEMEMRRMEALVGAATGAPPSNIDEWYSYWHQLATHYEEQQQMRQAAGAYWASSFFLFDQEVDPRFKEAVGKSRTCMQRALNPSIQSVAIPYQEGHTLPGYLLMADGADRRPLVIIQTGFDGTAEELLFFQMEDIVKHGFHCLAIEGPGQGRVILEQGLTFRPDWEAVIRPVVDFALQQPRVDGDKICLWGISFGGHLAARAAAFEPRIKATVVNGGILDFYALCISRGPASLDKQLDEPRIRPVIDRMIGRQMEQNLEKRWFFSRGMVTFGASSPSELLLTMRRYRLQEVVGQIRCPVLVCDSEDDFLVGPQPRLLFDALPGPKDYILFTRAEGAGSHCQAGAYALSNARILEWLDKQLGINES